jgi:hypothetical protein
MNDPTALPIALQEVFGSRFRSMAYEMCQMVYPMVNNGYDTELTILIPGNKSRGIEATVRGSTGDG